MWIDFCDFRKPSGMLQGDCERRIVLRSTTLFWSIYTMQLTTENSRPTDRSAIRNFANSHKNAEIIVVNGQQEPTITREYRAAYWTTPNGSLCLYPSAYRKAYGKPTYNHCQPEQITVGAGWILENAPGCLEFAAFGKAKK